VAALVPGSGAGGGTGAGQVGGPGRSPWAALAALVLCAAVYVPLARVGGSGLRAIFIVLAALAGWRLGMWGGLAAGAGLVPVVLGLTALAGGDVSGMLSGGGAVGAVVLVAAGATAGHLRDLSAARAAAEAALRAERDAARREQAEADHARAETRAVLDATGEAMVLVDPDRRFRLVNRAFTELLGVTSEEVLGRDFRELGAVVARVFADPDGFARLVAGTAAAPTRRFVADVRQRWPRERDLELTTAPVPAAPGPGGPGGAEGAARGRLYALRDVTHEREVARLKEEQRRLLEDELARASRLQADLLPQGTPTVPGFDFAARCLPARAVGGDFFDWHQPAPGVLTLTLGDVMGKGLPAALLMATVRAALEAVARHSPPARALEAVAAATERDLERTEAFVTLFHARADAATRRVEYADAGHGLVFVRRAGGAVERLPARGLPLGVVARETYPAGAVELAPGDALVVYSDGLVDAFPDPAPDPAALAARLTGAPSALAIVERLVTLATTGAPLPDDLTVVVLRCREEARPEVA
jgi:PAS domain-containing protein